MNRRCRRGLGAGRVTDGVEPEGPSAPARPVRLVPAPRPEAWIVEALGPLPQRIEELGPECRTSAAVDAVHDLRVATRRLREALRLFGPWLPGEETRRVRRRLRQITRGLGPVRDQDVALEFYTASRASGMAGWPGETDEAREWIARRCARERRAALPAMRRLIKRANCGRVRPEVEELLRALREGGEVLDPLPTPRLLASSVLGERFAEIRRHRDLMPGEPGVELSDGAWTEPMHRVRIGLKKLRYTLELVRPAHPPTVERSLRHLKQLQDEFGALQDLVTFGRMLEPDTPESLLTGWVPASREPGLIELRHFLRNLAERQAIRASSAFRRQFLGMIRPSLVLQFPDLAAWTEETT